RPRMPPGTEALALHVETDRLEQRKLPERRSTVGDEPVKVIVGREAATAIDLAQRVQLAARDGGVVDQLALAQPGKGGLVGIGGRVESVHLVDGDVERVQVVPMRRVERACQLR